MDVYAFSLQAHFFLADANFEAWLSHAARDVRPNTATKQWAGNGIEFEVFEFVIWWYILRSKIFFWTLKKS